MNDKITLEGIIVDGVIYAVALAPLNDISPCEYCDLRDKCSLFFAEDEEFEGSVDLGTLCRQHLSENQMFQAQELYPTK